MTGLTKEQQIQQFDFLSSEYIKLLNDKQVLLEWGKPQLEALYTAKIGCWQVERLQLQLQVKAIKLKIELVQGSINRDERIDINDVELAVAAELADAEFRIMKEIAKVENANHLLANLDTPERSCELRKIYRQLAKQLHPDLHPNLTEQQTRIWQMVLDAYKNGDLDTLRATQVVYEREITAAATQIEDYTPEELSLRLEVIKEGIRVLQAEINAIKNEFPFTIEQQIKDEDWVNAELERIHGELSDLRAYEAELSNRYKQLISTL